MYWRDLFDDLQSKLSYVLKETARAGMSVFSLQLINFQYDFLFLLPILLLDESLFVQWINFVVVFFFLKKKSLL